MDARKSALSDQVLDAVQHLCTVIFNAKSDKQLENVFGLTHSQLELVVKKMVNALPDALFERVSAARLDEIKEICAREFIFFQLQEKWSDPHYQEDLSHFIAIFSRDIRCKVDKLKNNRPEMGSKTESRHD